MTRTVDPTVKRTAKHAAKLRCARCDTRLADPSRRVYSTFTRLHYCSDVNGCGRRAARRARTTVRATA